MNIDEIINYPRISNADYHATLGKSWRKLGVKNFIPAPVAYSAFEYRLAIERKIFEIYIFIHNDGDLDSVLFTQEELSKIKNLSSLITIMTEEVGNKFKIYRLLVFNRIFTDVFINLPQKLCVPDIGVLKKYWHMLSDYCHQKFDPKESWELKEWVVEGYSKLLEVERYMEKILVEEVFGWPDKKTIDKEILDVRSEFLNNDQMKESQLILRLKIMKPVLDLRAKLPSIIKINK